MNGFDIALLVAMGVLVVIGLVKGLVRILIGILALVTAFFVASRYNEPLASRLGSLSVTPEVLMLVSYVLLFIGVMLAGGLVAWMLRRLIKAAMLSWADRMAGAAVGVLAALLAAALLVLPLVAYSPSGSELLSRSMLAPYVAVVADFAIHAVPTDLATRYREGMDALRRHWHGLDDLSERVDAV